MSFNRRKFLSKKASHYDKRLEENREERGHDKLKSDGTYNAALDKNRKNKEPDAIWEKSLEKKREQKDGTIEARMNAENLRDDRTHKTNTLPINELAEEAQRERIKTRGEPVKFEDSFQEYKKTDLGLSEENFARLKEISKSIDGIWRSASWDYLSSDEKKALKKLYAERQKFLR